MVQNQERDPKIVSQTISPEDVGSIDILEGALAEPTPAEVSVDEAVGEEKEELNWSPVESSKIIEHLDASAKSILELGTECYRNDGNTKYIAFTKGKRKTAVCVYLSRKSARISVGKLDGKKTTWPFNYKVTEGGYLLNGKKVKLTTIVSKISKFIGDKGW